MKLSDISGKLLLRYEISSHCLQILFSELNIVLPSESWILSIKIGSTNFPPFKKELYALVSLSNVVSADPKEMDINSSGLS